jgi:hypothetical protein
MTNLSASQPFNPPIPLVMQITANRAPRVDPACLTSYPIRIEIEIHFQLENRSLNEVAP